MGLSTHVLDTSRGRPAEGIPIVVEVLDSIGGWQTVGGGITDADGRIKGLLRDPEAFAQGLYRLTFSLDGYFSAQGVHAFYPQAVVEFRVEDGGQHFHIPLLLNPFGYSTYRGS